MLFAAIVAPIIALLLGNEWAPIVPLIQILAVGALFRVAAFSTSWVAASRGLNKISLYANLTGLPVTIGAILLGSHWGIAGIAVGQAVSGLTSWLLGLIWFAYMARTPSKRLFATSLELLATLVLPFSAGLLTVALTEDISAWTSLFAGAGAFVLVFALEALAFKRLQSDIRAVFGIVFSRGSSSLRR
jgi:PST family polysaccharide transporter